MPIGADDQQVMNAGAGRKQLQQMQACQISPLQIIEEDNQRMFFTRQTFYECLECQIEPVLRLKRPQFRKVRLLSDNQLKYGQYVST